MSTTMLPFTKGTTFGPEALASMGEAFDRACAAIGQVEALAQEVIAARIIELAMAGECHPQLLCDRALEALGLADPER